MRPAVAAWGSTRVAGSLRPAQPILPRRTYTIVQCIRLRARSLMRHAVHGDPHERVHSRCDCIARVTLVLEIPMKTLSILLTVLGIGLAFSAEADVKNVVLVHGAFADGS